jgi:MFS family permease
LPLEEISGIWHPFSVPPPPPVAEANISLTGDLSSRRDPNPIARLAASACFLTDGMIFGTWATLIPSFKSRFGVSEAELSIALLAIAAGAIVSMPVAGNTVARHGTRANLRFFAPGFCASLVLLAFSPNFPIFLFAAFLFGAVKGAFNVAVNSQAITIENAMRKPIIPTFHALWSLGGMTAALLVGMALKLGLGAIAISSGIAAILVLLVFVALPHLLGGDATPQKEKSGFQLPDGKILRIGIITAMALFAEGVMMDWSVVYSREVSAAAPWIAPLAYGVFSGCMATGRLGGSALLAHFGPAAILKLGGILTTAGLVIIVSIHHWPATFVGLALAGFGLSNLVPILFGAGGRAHEGGAGKGIAMVSMMGYSGFLIGPPLIGGVSHWAGLPGAFAIVVAFGAFIAFAGNRFLGKLPNPTQS